MEAGCWGGPCNLRKEAKRNLGKVNHEKGNNGEQKRGVPQGEGRNVGRTRNTGVSLGQQMMRDWVKAGEGLREAKSP